MVTGGLSVRLEHRWMTCSDEAINQYLRNAWESDRGGSTDSDEWCDECATTVAVEVVDVRACFDPTETSARNSPTAVKSPATAASHVRCHTGGCRDSTAHLDLLMQSSVTMYDSL